MRQDVQQPAGAIRIIPTWLKVKSQLTAGSSKGANLGDPVEDGPVPNVSKVAAEVPTWLQLKSGVKAGSKAVDFGGESREPHPNAGEAPKNPTWLQLKSGVKAGAKAVDFGAGAADKESPSLVLSERVTRVRAQR